MSDDTGRRGDRQRPPARERSAQHRSALRPSERARRTDPARLAAYTAMRQIAEGGYANLVLPDVLRERGITGRDAAFATELVYGATRWAGFYDAVIAKAAARPVSDIDSNILDTMRLGAHQLLSMRVPPHAAADETVALARQVNGAGAAGFVNAVMRRISERDGQQWADVVVEGITDPLEILAIRESHPTWVVKALRSALIGHGAADASTIDASLEDLLASDNTPAKVSLVARPGLSSVEELADFGAEPSRTSPVGATLDGGDPAFIGAVRDGRAAVQDEGSQLIALAMADADVSIPEGDEHWLDMCAGPGGKAGLLAAIAVQRRIPFVANEISTHRADLVEQTLGAAIDAGEQVDTPVEVSERDGREFGADYPGTFSRVLIDAPCTGLGALRRRPEARWRREPEDVAQLAGLQRDLLVSGIDTTASGGVIGYATCSPHLNETTYVLQDVLKGRDDVEVVDARNLFRDAEGAVLPSLGDGPFVQLWPHVHGTDGMFFALLRKL